MAALRLSDKNARRSFIDLAFGVKAARKFLFGWGVAVHQESSVLCSCRALSALGFRMSCSHSLGLAPKEIVRQLLTSDTLLQAGPTHRRSGRLQRLPPAPAFAKTCSATVSYEQTWESESISHGADPCLLKSLR